MKDKDTVKKESVKVVTKIAIFAGLSALLVAVASQSYTIVQEGYRGVYKRLGKAVSVEGPGLHFYMPFLSEMVSMDIRETKIDGRAATYTKDTQQVDVEYSVTYFPDAGKTLHLYSTFGSDWASKIIPQAVLGGLKDVVGQYNADDLIAKRGVAQALALKSIQDYLKERNVVITNLNFTNLAFEDAYEKAVEDKVVAIQRAIESKNRTVQVEEEARQRILAAEADAKAMQTKTDALKASAGLIQYEVIQRWDGKLPQYVIGEQIPFLNLIQK